MKNTRDTMENRNLQEEFIRIQNELFAHFSNDAISEKEIKNIAGVDLAYWKKEDKEYAVCCIVVLDYQTLDIVEKVEYMGEVECPYISGCLAFREVPLFMEANKKLNSFVDLYMFDGNGYLHPRHMGLATQAGIMIKRPTIGIAKKYFKIENVEYVPPAQEKFAFTDIIINGNSYGRAMRTQIEYKPIFLSVGNMIDLETATTITKALIKGRSRLPVTTRLADIETHKARKRYTI